MKQNKCKTSSRKVYEAPNVRLESIRMIDSFFASIDTTEGVITLDDNDMYNEVW